MAELKAEVGVVGLGAMGSMTLWQLARRGVSTVGLEQFELGHDRGSSHGESRIIRTAYTEGPQYVPLVQAAFPLWRQLEAEAGVGLLQQTGAVTLGPPGSARVQGVLRSIESHRLPHEVLDSRQLEARFPQHVVDRGEIGIFETQAGVIDPERAVAAALDLATGLGARTRDNVPVTAIRPDPDGVTVEAGKVTFRFERLVVAAGAWLSGLLPAAGLPVTVERQVQVWFELEDPAAYAVDRFPVFLSERGEDDRRYGFPCTDGRTLKVAVHHAGRPSDPDRLDREIHDYDLDPLRQFVSTRLRGVSTVVDRARACMYTNTPDDAFILSTLDELPNVVVVSACSGHGFKFAPVVGEVAADLAMGLATRHDVEFCSAARFARTPGAVALA
jgi:sarcosine oxidase